MKPIRALAVVLFAVVSAACAQKQSQMVQGVSIAEDKAGLWSKATISADSAVAIAVAQVPGGKVSAGELEEEDGTLIYSLDVSVPGKPGVTEIHIDARTGRVLKSTEEKP